MPRAPKKGISVQGIADIGIPKIGTEKNAPSLMPKEYNLSIQLGNEILKGSGGTALEALQSITRPTKIVTKGEIILTKGDKKAQMTWQPAKLKRLFYPLVQRILSKQLDYLMK